MNSGKAGKTEAKTTAPGLNLLDVAAYPLAAIPGYIAFENDVRKGSYTNLAKQRDFDDLQRIRGNDYALAKTEHAKGKLPNFSYAMERIESDYRHAVRDRFEEMGIKGMPDYWRGLQRNQKINALVLGATVSSIVLGAMLMINEHSALISAARGGDKER